MNTYTMDIRDIYSFSMIPAVKVRDLLRVRLMTSSEKSKIERGGNDIIAIDPFGHTETISRDDLLAHYTYLSGKKIGIAAWKSGLEYLVLCQDESPAFAMMIPENCQIQLNGKVYTPINKRGTGQYIVCLADADGNPDPNTLSVLSATMFHKIFYIPPSRVILRHKGSKRKAISKNIGETFRIGGRGTRSYNSGSSIFAGGRSEVDKKIRRSITKQRTEIHTKPTTPPRPEPIHTTRLQTHTNQEISPQVAPYKVVAQVVDEVYGQRVGFIISREPSGERKKITTEVLMKLCQSKKVSNAVVVVPETGKPFLRGRGISLDDLPIA